MTRPAGPRGRARRARRSPSRRSSSISPTSRPPPPRSGAAPTRFRAGRDRLVGAPALWTADLARAAAGGDRRRALRARHPRLALRDPRRRRRAGDRARQPAGRRRPVPRAGRAGREGAAQHPDRAAAGVRRRRARLGRAGGRRLRRATRPAARCSAWPTGLAYAAFLLVQRQGSMDLRRPAGALFDMSLVAAVVSRGRRVGARRRRPRADVAERRLADHARADLPGASAGC